MGEVMEVRILLLRREVASRRIVIGEEGNLKAMWMWTTLK